MHQQHVNVLILRSIPLDKSLKRFFVTDFQRVVKCNGPAFACERYKKLRETLMAYRSDPKRTKNLEHWLRVSGMRTTGWLRKLFRYMDTQPEYAIQFVKLYCGPNEPIVSVGEAAEAQHQVLLRAKSIRTATPRFLTEWVKHFAMERPYPRGLWSRWRRELKACPDWLRRFVKGHSYEWYLDYHKKWSQVFRLRLIRPDLQRVDQWMVEYEPSPELYCDFGSRELSRSQSLEDDVWQFAMMTRDWFPGTPDSAGVSRESLEFVMAYLHPDWVETLEDDTILVKYKPDSGASILDGTYVGHIHHIPKKGTVKRRSIAAPNRFLQMGMAPANAVLTELLQRLETFGKDCTFDQCRLNAEIVMYKANPRLYCGSVDLHQATDHLPFQWMETIWDIIFRGRVSDEVRKSWNLFCEVSKGAWYNEGYRDRWTVGQPLGALPSFRVLGITHNLVLESLAFVRGLDHSPYAVLGDDVLIMNRDLRKQYIKLMTNVGVPLSLHKSYDGHLVEFAGQLFIKNMRPFYNTDHRAITWESLFDYQRATGIVIPWQNLTAQLRRKVQAIADQHGIPRRKARTVYGLAQAEVVPARGSHLGSKPKGMTDDEYYTCVQIWYQTEKDSLGPVAPELGTGIMNLGGHPVTFIGYNRHTRACQYAVRVRQVRGSNWFKRKYRPVATDALISHAASVVREYQELKAQRITQGT